MHLRPISCKDYDLADSLKRNEIANTSFYVSAAGAVAILLIGNGILYGIHTKDSFDNTTWGYSVLTAWVSTIYIPLALP